MRKRTLGLDIACVLISSVLIVSCAQKSFQSDQSPMYTLEKRSDSFDDQNLPDGSRSDNTAYGNKTKKEILKEKDVFLNELIFFDFDSSTINAEAQSILRKKAEWLKENSKSIVIIEGHCDERGTEAYNLSLGERRAEHTKSFLVDSGISVSRLYTISYGEERPVDPGRSEQSWSQNRRVSFVIQ